MLLFAFVAAWAFDAAFAGAFLAAALALGSAFALGAAFFLGAAFAFAGAFAAAFSGVSEDFFVAMLVSVTPSGDDSQLTCVIGHGKLSELCIVC